ncbi:hypothetical protein JCM10213_005026 [Rhodosporidiobolus nylandii]
MLRNAIRIAFRAQSTAAKRSTPADRVSNPCNKVKDSEASSADKVAQKKRLDDDYKQRLEERFGGGESAALGELVNGQPEGQARNVKRNMFRLI